MKKLYVGEATFEAEKIIKNNDEIIGYIGDKEVFTFKGISDFSLFKLEEGQAFDISITLEEKMEMLEKENADLLLDSVFKDNRIEQNESDIADLLLIIGGIQ